MWALSELRLNVRMWSQCKWLLLCPQGHFELWICIAYLQGVHFHRVILGNSCFAWWGLDLAAFLFISCVCFPAHPIICFEMFVDISMKWSAKLSPCRFALNGVLYAETYFHLLCHHIKGCLPMHSYSSCLHCEFFTSRSSCECPKTLNSIVALKLSFISFLHCCTVCDMVEAWAIWFVANKKGNSAKQTIQKIEGKEDNRQHWLTAYLHFPLFHMLLKRKNRTSSCYRYQAVVTLHHLRAPQTRTQSSLVQKQSLFWRGIMRAY